MEPGQVCEIYCDLDQDMDGGMAAEAVMSLHKLKEQYPDFVLHYVSFETRKVTAQISIAPPAMSISGYGNGSISQIAIAQVILIMLVAMALIAVIVAAIGLVLRWVRGYLWSPPPPVGTAVITAEDANTKLGLHNVPVYMDGTLEGRTDGGSITVKNVLQGDHKFSGGNLSGYQTPDIVTVTIVKDQVKNITIWYYPTGSPKPTTGILEVYTEPPGGEVYVDTIDKGPAPISMKVTIGAHSVGFGPLEGYITPIVQAVTVSGPEPVVVTGSYLLPGQPWWQSLIKWAALGLTATAAAAILIPRIAEAARKKGGA
jgi:hypothetical protein